MGCRLIRLLFAWVGTLLLPLTLLTGARAAHAGALEFLEVHIDGTAGVDGLDGSESLAMSPDGAYLYAGGSDESAIAIFHRDAVTGHLTYLGSVVDGVDGVDGLGNVRGIAISPDGVHLYAAGFSDDAVAVFERDTDMGALTFVEVHKDNAAGITTLNGAFGISVSPDGANVYVTSNIEDALTVFRRDSGTGRLSLVEAHVDGDGITSLDGAEMVTVSPDGAHVYVASEDADAITVFRRDEDTGTLRFVEAKKDQVDGINALDRVQSVAVSGDGAHVYAASGIDNAVVVFSRDAATGRLTLVEVQQNGVGGVDGLGGAEWVTVSANGAYVYAASDVDNALVVFARDPLTGKLSYIESHRNGTGGANGLRGAEAVIASGDTAYVYVVSDADNAVAVFASLCGNGRFDAGEGCDDGNTVGGDCCSASCGNEPAGSACPDDGNVCTDEQCNGAGICLHVNNTAPCDDGAYCSVNDVCEAGVCGGTARDCSAAGDQCSDGVCDEVGDECVAQPVADGTLCDDGDRCTQSDGCVAGICVGADPVICTALDQCHDAGECSPATGECSNPAKVNGTVCDDGSACTQADACAGGICVGMDPIICVARNQCHDAGECNPITGQCSDPHKADGTACDDGSTCTRADACIDGMCMGMDPVICTALDQCHDAGECNPATGECSNPAMANGKACDDGNACTRADACVDGTCMGMDPVSCAALDQCHDAGECNPATGECSNPYKADATACDDGNACTQADICIDGSCVGTDPVSCTELDQCHAAGECDPATGLCSTPEKPTLTVARFMADADTYTDAGEPSENFGVDGIMRVDRAPVRRVYLRFTLSGIEEMPVALAIVRLHTAAKASSGSDDAGEIYRVSDWGWDELTLTHDNRPSIDGEALSGTGPVVPSQAVDFDVTAAIAGDGVYSFAVEAGSDDGAIYVTREGGAEGPEIILFTGTSCDDGNACTRKDACVAGSCVGAEPVICTASDQCHEAGVCEPETGMCSDPDAADGTVCDDGDLCTQTDVCANGVCVGADPVLCAALDQCHAAGECDSETGLCSDPAAANGSPCDDGNVCTRTDACADGVCVGADPVICMALDQCHDAGVCDPATGQCSNPARADGTACDDDNACTQSDTCVRGTCTGSVPVVCKAPDQCHEAGVCDPATGRCAHAARADGVPCDDGDLCSVEDACIEGECIGIPSPDADADGICDAIDLCPGFRFPDQWDMDHDGVGDFCQCNSPAPGRCIAGGGSRRTDCLLEINSPGRLRFNRTRTRVKSTIRCHDGDPACDMDSVEDGKCTFAVSLCFGNSDPRYPKCTPDVIHSMEVLNPRVARRGRTSDILNATHLERGLAELGLGIQRRGQVIAESIAPIGGGFCTTSMELVVPAPRKAGARPVRRRFRVRATDMSGRRDTDRFVLICK